MSLLNSSLLDLGHWKYQCAALKLRTINSNLMISTISLPSNFNCVSTTPTTTTLNVPFLFCGYDLNWSHTLISYAHTVNPWIFLTSASKEKMEWNQWNKHDELLTIQSEMLAAWLSIYLYVYKLKSFAQRLFHIQFHTSIVWYSLYHHIFFGILDWFIENCITDFTFAWT